ncbi:MAG: hypothetical protein UW37_C0004G0005 [Candidatus Gottesmanbacteria bacterium GW2011_GWA2_44_17]|uniref:LytR/CpsA/Psr regulator C-terminal domain-containing protein n=3 Tax=Candidatus Gottesmaniibacteriota TaxID=1752720 RepID=A0A0G1KYK6_9BACT|nr:MAG: hypothetical protein UV63_C0046G0005 [Microgenomates group bacterium GW2011_GWC1_43_11]KKT34596.1 MAG: hypothetical protein UW22_C0070G0004 [Candidatus Gottesmanbacteria bacterium GW2011_GWB1_44_11c]KKT47714.1 MAG: hypothetical protein UW37_C0004G0005 [Candidatus Gottesmanbacteria bacterium GW2011_GWA2_44_17]KKT61442.1 MAG: hypothetical protein UW52_C0003G0005 [Candidatus Gottesmanbacteria bacterium GW2011_GWA1_44_24b]
MSARTKRKNPWMLLGVVAVGIISIPFASIFFIHSSVPGRIGVAVVGEPTVVFSYDPMRPSITAVSIPSDVYVDVTRGYGAYPLSSVWKLDRIDKRRGVIFTETLEEAIGIPVRFFVEPSKQIGASETLRNHIGNALSFSSFLRTLVDKKRTNIHPWLFMKISRAFQSMNPTEISFFDLKNQAVFIDGTLADGTSVKKIDTGKLALLFGTLAEDAQIRKENLRIAVYNTTRTPGLAQKVSRVIESSGFHVSSIDNDETVKTSQCILRGKREVLQTVTVKTLVWLYGCFIQEEMTDSRSDVTLLIGTDFEKRYVSY